MTRSLLLAGTIVGALFGTAPALSAQEPGQQRTDRVGHIVAVVGDSVILNFDIQEGILARAAAARQEPPQPGTDEWRQIEQVVLEDLIAEMLVLQAALRDTTIIVQDDDIARAVQRQIEQDQEQLGGVAALERELKASGRTMLDYRTSLTTQYRKRELIRGYQAKVAQERRPPRVTDDELREAFEQQRARFPMREASITFQQVVVRTEPSEQALESARVRADSVFRMIVAGGDFETLARRYSDDGTRETGGDLGFIRRNDVVREFADAAFSLMPGAVSMPVRTQYGYHLIKVERIRGAEVQARHILFRPEITDADAFRARARADTVAERVRAGDNMSDLAARFGDRDTPLRGGPTPVDTLQRFLGMDLSAVGPGDVIGPIPVGGTDIANEFMVVRIVEKEAAREWRLDDPQLGFIREQVAQQKLINEIVEELRRSTYIEIRTS